MLNLANRTSTTLVLLLALLAFVAVSQVTAEEKEKSKPVYIESTDHFADKNVGYGAETSFLTWHGYLNFEFDQKQGTNSNFERYCQELWIGFLSVSS